MIRIYSVEEAKGSILQRRALQRSAYAPDTIARTEAYFGEGVEPPQAVQTILRSVEAEGDAAVRRWSSLLDNFESDADAVSPEAWRRAWERLNDQVRQAMLKAIERIRVFHERQSVTSWLDDAKGGQLGQRFTPIERIGIYVPGGTAPLPSSLYMSAVPALIAGVKQIVVCTPPPAHKSILAAAHLCDIDQLFQIGGAQAIAALAFGTESVPRVDKIVGAGNLFVTLAKQQLYGVVGLDGLAGPTETMIIADSSARPDWLAADLLAQAEHDIQASAILLTPHL